MALTVTEDVFAELAAPLRRELLAHCYRMTGSAHEAEDLVQETYLRAWRAFHNFENRSSLRTWMYRIATNTCLTALEGRGRRPLPVGLGTPPSDPANGVQPRTDVAWLEPLPDDVLWSAPEPDPGEAAVGRESIRLAFVAAIQHLTPQQRAALLLKDVLAWSAAEIATALDMTVAGVNSTLQRARAHVAEMADGPATLPDGDPRLSALLDDYVTAFETYDIPRIVELLTEDARWDMPPYPEWFQGAAQIGRLIATQCPADGPGAMRLVRTSANGAPALALYMRADDGVHRAFHLQHLTVTEDGVASVTAFFGGPELFARFGLPAELAR